MPTYKIRTETVFTTTGKPVHETHYVHFRADPDDVLLTEVARRAAKRERALYDRMFGVVRD